MVRNTEWEKISVGEILAKSKSFIQTGPFGTVLSADEFSEYGIPVISVREIREGYIQISSETPCVSEEIFHRLSKYALKKNDIVFARKGSVDRSAIISSDKKKYFLGSDGIYLRLDSKEFCPEFVMYCLQSSEVKSYILQNSYGSTMAGLNEKILSSILLPNPPALDEQQKVAGILSDLDDMITSLENLIAKKKAIKQGAMQELLSGAQRLHGFKEPFTAFSFAEVFSFIPNNAFTRAEMAESGTVKNVHYGDILTKYGVYIEANDSKIPYLSRNVDLSRFGEKSYLQSGDIILADTAEDETVGKAVEIINVNSPILAGQHTLLCRPKVRFAPKFLGYYLNSGAYHDQLLSYIVGTKVSSVSKASVSKTTLLVPCYEEQQAIASVLSDMDSEIEALEQKLIKCHEAKQGMMQQLLTGKIRLI